MKQQINVADSAKLTDLAAVRGLEELATVVEEADIETVGELRGAAFEKLGGVSAVLDVSFARGVPGGSTVTVTIEASPLDTHVGDELDLTLDQFSSRLETGELALAGEW